MKNAMERKKQKIDSPPPEPRPVTAVAFTNESITADGKEYATMQDAFAALEKTAAQAAALTAEIRKRMIELSEI